MQVFRKDEVVEARMSYVAPPLWGRAHYLGVLPGMALHRIQYPGDEYEATVPDDSLRRIAEG